MTANARESVQAITQLVQNIGGGIQRPATNEKQAAVSHRSRPNKSPKQRILSPKEGPKNLFSQKQVT